MIFFFSWLIFFFWLKAKKKILSQGKKILTNKRSYSSNGNTIMPMIFRFYATHSQNFPWYNKIFWKILGFFRHKSLPVRKFPGLLQTFFNFCVLYNMNKKTLWKKFQGIPNSKLKTFIMFSKWSKFDKNNKSRIRWSIIVPTMLFSKIWN